ncbi:MAG: Endonuclease-8 [Klenkia sp.]|nr:Endonuclease-8 [Klenkia sp.]
MVHTDSAQGRFAEGAAALDGRTLRSTEAFGQNLFLRSSGDSPQHLRGHPGLIGGWTWWESALSGVGLTRCGSRPDPRR